MTRHSLPAEARWSKALKKAQKNLDRWLKLWNDRPIDQWCHGDLHLGNAMTRCAAPQGPAVLIDFAQVHAGYWVEDAVYFEHLYWSRRQHLGGRHLCKAIAHDRRQRGLAVEASWADHAQVMRALLAMGTPVILHQDGPSQHVHAALEILEREVG